MRTCASVRLITCWRVSLRAKFFTSIRWSTTARSCLRARINMDVRRCRWRIRAALTFREHVARGSADEKTLLQINKKLIRALGLERGATHAEFIKSDADGKFYFLEIAARVGGAYIADVLEAASGVNLWREWARLEIADGKAPAKITPLRKEYAGIILSLAKQEQPDTSAYVDEEIVYRVKKRHHAGLIVRARAVERVNELLDDYGQRFVEDFVAVAPPPERPE